MKIRVGSPFSENPPPFDSALGTAALFSDDTETAENRFSQSNRGVFLALWNDLGYSNL
jgi:hypothetical protein